MEHSHRRYGIRLHTARCPTLLYILLLTKSGMHPTSFGFGCARSSLELFSSTSQHCATAADEQRACSFLGKREMYPSYKARIRLRGGGAIGGVGGILGPIYHFAASSNSESDSGDCGTGHSNDEPAPDATNLFDLGQRLLEARQRFEKESGEADRLQGVAQNDTQSSSGSSSGAAAEVAALEVIAADMLYKLLTCFTALLAADLPITMRFARRL